MTWLNGYLLQTGTLWQVSTRDKYGDETFGTPVSLDPANSNYGIRWENKVEKFITAGGDESHSRAVVYTVYAVSPGDWLYLGTSAGSDPEAVSGADQVRHVDKVPDLRNQYSLYRCLL